MVKIHNDWDLSVPHMDFEAEVDNMTAIINRIITSNGDMQSLWMNMDLIPTVIKYYDAFAAYAEYIRETAGEHV